MWERISRMALFPLFGKEKDAKKEREEEEEEEPAAPAAMTAVLHSHTHAEMDKENKEWSGKETTGVHSMYVRIPVCV